MIQYILVQYQTDLNEQIQKPIQQSSRIKFTCFDVSINHIVFGARSGGLYIYKRKPCVFLKILPTKEGAIDQLSISDDECFVAASNRKGLIIIIENCFTGHDVKFQIYNQHDNNKITALKWHFHELYSGDINGKVCVTALKNILSKSLFQIPFATLMHLDSSIVQIDCYLHFLLISTLTKTLFCDTAHEQYKQIGKKLRDGPHGACFQNVPEKIFQYQAHSSADIDVAIASNVRVFCSRPGLRLWEVDFNTSVICTHQFKNAKPLGKCVYKVTYEKNCRAIKDNIYPNADNDASTNFYRMHLLKYNLMLTFNENAVYILRVTESKVTLLYKLLFSACLLNIRIVDDVFYVLLETWELRSYSIFNLENFIMYAWSMEQYLLCADICVHFKENVYEVSEGILHILWTLKLNLEGIQDLNILDELKDLFEFISSKHKKLTLKRNGVENVAVENDSAEINDEIIGVNKFDDDCFCASVIIKQFKLNVQYHVDYSDYIKLLEQKSLIEIRSLFENIVISEEVEQKDVINNWCSKQFLILVTNNITSITNDTLARDYALKCFRNINKNPDKICGKCKYPMPTAKDAVPCFYNLICDIFKNEDVILTEIAAEVPYIWKYLLVHKLESINKEILSLIIQFSDITVLEHYSNKLNYDQWDEAVSLMIKMKTKRCLYCDDKLEIDVASTLGWQCFANVAMRTMGPTGALKLFKSHAGFISNVELGPEFYQNFIFIAAMDNAGKNRGTSTQIFQSAMVDESQKIEMETSLAKYLNNAFLQRNKHSHLDTSPISTLKNILSKKL